jgi:hypothetical protein
MWKLMRGKRGSNGEESVEVNERRVSAGRISIILAWPRTSADATVGATVLAAVRAVLCTGFIPSNYGKRSQPEDTRASTPGA